MICDQTDQIDIRKVLKSTPILPEILFFHGHEIETTWTETNFGGRRCWFLCPTCNRRCAIVYRSSRLGPGCCRVCGKGRYISERKSPQQRKLAKAFKIRARLGQRHTGILSAFPAKPNRMHRSTYERIRTSAETLESEVLQKALRQLARWDPDGKR